MFIANILNFICFTLPALNFLKIYAHTPYKNIESLKGCLANLTL